MDQQRLERVRRVCAGLPEFGLGEPGPSGVALQVAGKTFANFWDNHHDDGRIALWCKAHRGAQQELVGTDPQRYFVPPYVGVHGWVGVRLDGPAVDWVEVGEILQDAYRMVASKRLIAELDTSS